MSFNRNTSVWLLMTALLAAAFGLSLFTGAVRLPIVELWQTGILRLRLLRAVLAMVAGAGLSTAGVIFQAVLRNPLAEPYVLGVSAGAGLAAAVAIVAGLTALGVWTLPLSAFAGAMAAVAGVYALARSPGGTVPVHTLLLSGAMVGSILGSLLMFVVSLSSSQRLHGVIWWLLGSLQALDQPLLAAVAAIVTVCLMLAVAWSGDLDLLALGDETAAHLGLEVERAKGRLLLIASAITGATVAACGLIGFVGLIVPHAMRLVLGPDHRRLLPAAALAGAIFLLLTDTAARTALAPREVPIGVATSLVGGPMLLVLLRRRMAAEERD